MPDNPSPHHLQAALETIGIRLGHDRATAVFIAMGRFQAEDDAADGASDQALMGGIGACEACEILAGPL